MAVTLLLLVVLIVLIVLIVLLVIVQRWMSRHFHRTLNVGVEPAADLLALERAIVLDSPELRWTVPLQVAAPSVAPSRRPAGGPGGRFTWPLPEARTLVASSA